MKTYISVVSIILTLVFSASTFAYVKTKKVIGEDGSITTIKSDEHGSQIENSGSRESTREGHKEAVKRVKDETNGTIIK